MIERKLNEIFTENEHHIKVFKYNANDNNRNCLNCCYDHCYGIKNKSSRFR